MHAKHIIWLLMAAALLFAGCTKLSTYTGGTAAPKTDCATNCTTDYTPVCGMNNKTYWNACTAGCAGITVARQGDCKPAATAKTCNDSDGGKDASVKGTVTGSDGVSHTDSCADAATVLEYYCSGPNSANEEIACNSGYECNNGVCVKKQAAPAANSTPPANSTVPSTPACTDSDEGKNATVKGTVTVGSDMFTDTCNGTATVKEYYCDGNESASRLMDCPEGTTCKSGACAQSERSGSGGTCSDTEDGQDIYAKGTITVNGTLEYPDYCYNRVSVIEYYCDSAGPQAKRTACPGGGSCTNGACAK